MAVFLIVLLEALSLVPLGLIGYEFYRGLRTGPDMGYIAVLAYVHIGTGLLAAGIAHLARLPDWKAYLLGLHALALEGAGSLLCLWAVLNWAAGWHVAAAGGLLVVGVASMLLGFALAPEHRGAGIFVRHRMEDCCYRDIWGGNYEHG